MSAASARLRALPVLALLLGAIDTVLARLENDHRPRELALFLQAVLIWSVFLSIAWPPAALLGRLLGPGRRLEAEERAPLRPALLLLFCAVAPVAAHVVLDRHTSVGADVAELLALRPWLEVLAAVAALALVLWGAGRALSRVPRWRLLGAAAVLAIAAGIRAPLGGSAAALPAGGEPGAARRPNLLLLVWDTARAGSVQPFGADRETTPELARLADTSLVYSNARAASRFTFTSHLSMLTGAHPSHHGARLLDSRYRSARAEHVAALLRQAGYRTAGFVGTDVLSGRTGIDFGFEVFDDRVDPPVCDTRAWKLVHDLQAVLAHAFEALRFDGRPHWFQDFQRPADGPLDAALEWTRNGDPRPWFCFVNLYDAHWPYLPSESARARLVRPYSGPMDGFAFRSDAYPDGRAPDAADDRHLADLYEAELWELDRRVEAFLGALDLFRGETALILTSDHGEAFGEGGAYEHDDVLEPQLRVPLLVRHAGSEPPRGRVELPVSGVDVAPTLLGLAGLDVPAEMDGVDLARSAPAPDRALLSEDRDHVDPLDVRLVLVRGRFRLEVRGLGPERRVWLHDLERDPVGEVDAGDAHPAARAELLAELDALRARWGGEAADAAPVSGSTDADALGALGYTGTEPRPEEDDPELAEPARRP